MAPLAAYLVRGDDPVLRAEATRDLIHELVGDGDPALMVEEYDAVADVDTAAIADAAQTPPFLTERRVIVARDVSTYSSEQLAPLLAYLESPLTTTSLVLIAGGKGGRLSPKLVSAVKQVGHVVEAGIAPTKRARTAWLAGHLKDAPVRLDPAAVDTVEKHLGDDLGRLRNLLESVAAAYGVGARLGPDDIEPFLGEAGSVPPWELTDAIDAREPDRALGALQRMLGAGDRHPLQIMATLHAHYARMLRLDGAGAADEAAAAAVLGIKAFPAGKALTQVRRLGHAGVATAIALLAEADLDLRKLRKDWPETLVVEVLVARLSRLGPARGAGAGVSARR